MNIRRNIITMAHGSGGRATSDLINSTVIKHFGVQILNHSRTMQKLI